MLFKDPIITLKQKLNRANGILANDIIKTVYYSLFDTHLHNTCQVWAQSNSDIVRRAQTKALKIINFKDGSHTREPLFTEEKILNLTDIITLNNCMHVFDHLNSSFPSIIIFDDLLKTFKKQPSHNTRQARRYNSQNKLYR